jgi:hypothetical protein
MARDLYALKTSFTSGELDPELVARNDIKHYYSGAELMADVTPKAQGGFVRRPGLGFRADVTADIGDGSAAWAQFIFDPDTTYGLLFLDTKIKVFRNLSLVYTITSTPWEDSDIADGISYCQDADTMIVFCNLVQPHTILRVSDTSWTIAPITFDAIPQYDYVPNEDDRSSSTTPAGTLTPSAISGSSITLTRGTSGWVAGDVGKFVFGNGGVARIVSYSSGTVVGAKVLVDFFDTSAIPTTEWTLDAAAIVPNVTTGNVKIDASGPIFSSADVGQKIDANGALIRITQYISDVQILGVIEIPFASTDPVPSGQWVVNEGFEDAWSDARGWPTHGCFHQGRLVLAGGPRLAAWGSRVGYFYDFALSSGLDADPWEITIAAGGKVTNIASLKDLVIFTTGAEFVDNHKPITPGNVSPESVTKIGSEPGIVLVDLDGEAVFVQKGGKSLRQHYYDNDKQNYVGDDITLLSSHLINGPVSMARRKRTSTTESDQLLIVNGDGTARRCNLIMGQDVLAWSRVNSAGATFLLTGVDNEDVYFLVQREIDGSTVYYVESFDEDLYLDCSVKVTAGMPTDALVAAHLANEEITVMADDIDMGEYTLDGSGEATLARDAEVSYEIGYNFVPTVTTMPVEPELKEGTRLGKKKRISEVTVQLKDTNGLTINGQDIQFRRFGTSLLDQAIPLFTGRKRLRGFKGWTLQAQITITQPRPGKMHVLALSAKVSV